MSKTITKFKFFWPHQDAEQEAWLRAMALQGLHLESVNPLCFWTFRRGAPADIVYRVDFSGAANKDDFKQLMQDAGWTLASQTSGWDYWCIPLINGREPEIFTDGMSKAKKFERALGFLAASALPAFVMLVITDKELVARELSLPFLIPIVMLYLGYFVFLTYTVLRLLLRIREVRAPQRA